MSSTANTISKRHHSHHHDKVRTTWKPGWNGVLGWKWLDTLTDWECREASQKIRIYPHHASQHHPAYHFSLKKHKAWTFIWSADDLFAPRNLKPQLKTTKKLSNEGISSSALRLNKSKMLFLHLLTRTSTIIWKVVGILWWLLLIYVSQV